MRILNNNREVNLMLWEINPYKINVNNEIKFITSYNDVSVGDVIKGGLESFYNIIEIKEKRPASLKGKTYYTAITNWRSAN